MTIRVPACLTHTDIAILRGLPAKGDFRKVEKIRISDGIYWVSIPEENLYMLCGCPADSVKHMMKRGLIQTIERNGVRYETGPNAILLSDVALQNGSFANLAEFPCLQMFYRQGMLLPGHPNNSGIKPLIIGHPDQVLAQSQYIFRGNYGLVSEDELMKAGVSAAEAREMMRLKQKFAFDNIRPTEDLLDLKPVAAEAVEIRNGVFVHRTGFNVFDIIHNGQCVTVDLNLPSNETYKPPYMLGYHNFRREYFSVIHAGEGDGWDVNRPCMSSIIVFQGRVYLIDAGPNIMHSLTALGIGVNEIEGIFHTHAHDDHFSGLTTLVRADHLIKYYSTPLVRASVMKKLSALMGIAESKFSKYFDIHDLEMDRWNNIRGLEVKPVFSPHPVETTVMFFRTVAANGYKSYAHLADTVSLDVLRKMITGDPSESGVTQEFFDHVRNTYLVPVDLKKIDIGGGLIHGVAEDFIEDKSGRVILSHTAVSLSDHQKEIGSNAVFGMNDVLIPARQDYLMANAAHYLKLYFPSVPGHEIQMLINNDVIEFNAGTIMIKKGVIPGQILLALNGVTELIDSVAQIRHTLSAGSLIGEIPGIMAQPAKYTYRAASYVKAVAIPVNLYLEFVRRNNLYESIIRINEFRQYLISTSLFGEMVSYPIQSAIAQVMERRSVTKGDIITTSAFPELIMVNTGTIKLFSKSKVIERIQNGGFFGEDSILFDTPGIFSAKALTHTELYVIPGSYLINIPIVQWKLIEMHDRRMRTLGTYFPIEWRDEYSVHITHLDAEHRELFAHINSLYSIFEKKASKQELDAGLAIMMDYTREHFASEESFLRKYDYPEMALQEREHGSLLGELQKCREEIASGNRLADTDFVDFLKNWMLKHFLVEDRKYSKFFREIGVSG